MRLQSRGHHYRIISSNKNYFVTQMSRPKLFEWEEWCDRAEKLGFKIQWDRTSFYVLRRESDGEVMFEADQWEAIAQKIEELERVEPIDLCRDEVIEMLRRAVIEAVRGRFGDRQ